MDVEKLEQLRWLEHGYPIHVGLTDKESKGVDTPEDLVPGSNDNLSIEITAEGSYVFTLDAFNYAMEERRKQGVSGHISGAELCHGIRVFPGAVAYIDAAGACRRDRREAC